jgi:hypothetical protein
MENINGTIYGITHTSPDGTTNVNDLVTVDLAASTLTVVRSNINVDGIAMAYNVLDDKTYVTAYGHQFGTIDLETGVFTQITMLPTQFAIAIDNTGVCYAQGINVPLGEAKFGKMNLVTGAVSQMTVRTGTVEYVQNIEIDRTTNKLYWIKRASEIEDTRSNLVEIDKATGELINLEYIRRFVESFVIINSGTYTVMPTP